MVRIQRPILIVVATAFAIGAVASVASAEITALAYRDNDGRLLQVPLPNDLTGQAGAITSTFVGDMWAPLGSTRNSLGRILSLTFDGELVSFDPSSGIANSLCVIDQTGIPTPSDVALSPTGGLVLAVPSSGQTELYWIDTADCSLTEYATLPEGLVNTIEFHHGALYFGSATGIHSFDPVTTTVETIRPASLGVSFPGLASDGEHLWCLSSATSGGAPPQTTLGVLDIDFGTFLWSTPLPVHSDFDRFTILEVIEQQPPSIPTVQPVLLIVLAGILGLVGFLIIRN